MINELTRLLDERSTAFRHFIEALDAKGSRPIALQNLGGSALAFVVAALLEKKRIPILILTGGIDRAEDLVNDLEFFGVEDVHHYPKWEVLPYDPEELNVEVTAKHLDVFDAFAGARRDAKRAPIVTAPIDALMMRVLPSTRMDALTVEIEWGMRAEISALAKRLADAGYAREPVVESRGEYSIRGNILDVFPMNAEDPIRVDFFGDEIESLRLFDVNTQRSRSDLGTGAKLRIQPVGLKQLGEIHVQGGGKLASLLDMLPERTLVILDAPERHDEVCSHFENAVQRQYHDVLKESPDLATPESLIQTRSELLRALEKFRRIEHTELPIDSLDKTVVRIPFDTRGYGLAGNDIDGWRSTLRKLQEHENLLLIVCDNDGQVQRLNELLLEGGIATRTVPEGQDLANFRADVLKGTPDVLLTTGRLSVGFYMPGVLLGLLTDREMFGRYKRRHVYKKIYKGKAITSSAEIQRGDFVVHVEHGIGRYLGMRQQVIDGRAVDLIDILYADNNKLLVPVENIRLVQKYSGAEAGDPQLDRLGSGRWQKRRAKSREEVEKIANELLELYAKREVARRKSYGPDTLLMREFEAGFLYEETEDQLSAIAALKEDMEGPKPMDRVLCGDVGFGKTEVAIRAVFKCVQGGRQAAVLCPTTILAQQHYLTMCERFADFPVRVDVVSRFRSAKESKDALAKLKTGEIDVLVGTHRLLSKDVKFLDLGLLVVDEEHRFGVASKERLRELRADVDMLTLSATPIPRTLHMALSGIRDLSIIATPPIGRSPIKTKLIHFEEEQVAEAILRELNRDGQVYFVHNRVMTIHEVAKRLHEIVPHARITVAHGQMKESELEEVMMQFIDHQFDILIATTIIESGLDIPNCNTIIINRADTLGLSQLYQLRGRVGREKRRAYAYMIVPPGEGITDAAVKRLAAIEEFTELGSGFNIAMRDMEIRGTGNLLGKEQHGTINDIGFELYCEMLRDAVARLRGDEVLEDRDAEIKTDVSSVIPPVFIPVEAQRLNFYKRLAAAREDADIADVETELRDRYGEPPESVLTLLATTRIRLACRPLKIGAVKQTQSIVRLTFFAPEAESWIPDCQGAMKQIGAVTNVRTEGRETLVLMMKPKAGLELIVALNEFLRKIHAISASA